MQEERGGVTRSRGVGHQEYVVKVPLDACACKDFTRVGDSPVYCIAHILHWLRKLGFWYETVVGNNGKDPGSPG